MFKTIPVKPSTTIPGASRSDNSSVLETAAKVIKENGRVALFPQGNFAKLGKEPPIIYPGAARLAIQTKTPIHVIRLDGFWCIQNPLLPQSLRNNAYYRAFFSIFHPNNITTTLCSVIDFHLLPANQELSDDEKINEINAQLYAFFRHTGELTPRQIADIKQDIAAGKHRAIWKNRFERHSLEKELRKKDIELQALEENTLLPFQP